MWQTSVSQLRGLRLGAAFVYYILLLLPWFARSIILSGYPLFPATIFAVPVPWKIPLSAARWYALSVQSWGRGPDSHFADTRGLHWLAAWLIPPPRTPPSVPSPLAPPLA